MAPLTCAREAAGGTAPAVPVSTPTSVAGPVVRSAPARSCGVPSTRGDALSWAPRGAGREVIHPLSTAGAPPPAATPRPGNRPRGAQVAVKGLVEVGDAEQAAELAGGAGQEVWARSLRVVGQASEDSVPGVVSRGHGQPEAPRCSIYSAGARGFTLSGNICRVHQPERGGATPPAPARRAMVRTHHRHTAGLAPGQHLAVVPADPADRTG